MPAVAKCIRLDIRANGSRIVSFDDGSALEFASIEEMQAYADEAETTDLAKRYLIARYLRADADGSDTAAIVNRTATINVGAPSPVQIG
jgi:hypothetical protein